MNLQVYIAVKKKYPQLLLTVLEGMRLNFSTRLSALMSNVSSILNYARTQSWKEIYGCYNR
uniref:Uncharacterized protein n=1 Tax=Lepeophtheirus salmonis TaxID=72036 RepID=A0A0K2UDT8_LEPSM